MVRTFPVHGWLLNGDALKVARALYHKYPEIEITSGKRSIEAQASAMAVNEAKSPGWISKTYKESKVKRALTRWLGENKSRKALYTGFLAVLRTFTDDDLAKFSFHLGGAAFDVRPLPPGPRADEVKAWLYAAAIECGGKFLEKEGDLIIWHWQAKAPA